MQPALFPHHPAPFPHRFVPSGRQIRHDPALGHAFLPQVHTRVPHEHGAYFTVTNREGFREDHDLATPPPGLRVLCYGDSYAAGDGVDNAERFTPRLGELLGITVSNVAVPGHGPDQNLLQLESGAMPRPDLILWCIAVHTLERIRSTSRITIDREGRMWRVTRPHFQLLPNGELELRGVPVPEHGERLEEPAPTQIQGALATRVADVLTGVRRRFVARFGTWLKPPPDPEYDDPAGEPMQLLTAIVRRFHRAAADVPIAIVPLPTARYLVESRQPLFQQRFEELADPTAGLHVLDVTHPLQHASPAARAGFHYRLDGHFTRSGHVAVARALADQLLEHGLVPDSRAPVASAAATTAAPAAGERSSITLVAGWELADSFAELRDSGGQLLGSRRRESEFATNGTRPGTLPLSAVHAVLEQARIAGPELVRIELRSPCSGDALLDTDLPDSTRVELAAGHVRWRVAAAGDLRTFLAYEGPVVHAFETLRADDVDASPVTTGADEELRWLQARLPRVLAAPGPRTLERRIERLARLWELATRTARETMLPTTAPLRRGRMARQLQAAASSEHDGDRQS
ncbi:MAG: hypothetical protein NXI31_23870 [bacterium]|nr:hypothetical protein [bacterium]